LLPSFLTLLTSRGPSRHPAPGDAVDDLLTLSLEGRRLPLSPSPFLVIAIVAALSFGRSFNSLSAREEVRDQAQVHIGREKPSSDLLSFCFGHNQVSSSVVEVGIPSSVHDLLRIPRSHSRAFRLPRGTSKAHFSCPSACLSSGMEPNFGSRRP